ncbi:flavodoxin [Actinobacillus succinogenes]|uniref:Flavodoxin n=1 Tax=Actinobacillus succinogenes (strain ATCC 55618 / DSM 22257 / CCUG 43843 / 130Z) TaxID=339671 RepID=A6VR41_ACTSZ|nr:flavodoxin [Actinobacillus succinogenes]ABR75438.1 flavodoxin [Actinobacillus succinogenes 130Z]PHI40174.1 flavodoxin [Actinobacillus succinogenes]
MNQTLFIYCDLSQKIGYSNNRERKMMKTLTVLFIALFATQVAQAKNLIIYFSQPENYTAEQLVDGVSGASKLIKNGEMLGANEYLAKEIQKTAGGELFRLETVKPYPTTHQPLLDYAQNEQRQNIKPELKALPNLDGVDTVFLVYPIWWYKAPMAWYSLLEQTDFSGKTIVPVVGHGGSRFSGTDRELKKLAPNAIVKDGFEAYLHKSVRAEPQVEAKLAEFLQKNGYAK